MARCIQSQFGEIPISKPEEDFKNFKLNDGDESCRLRNSSTWFILKLVLEGRRIAFGASQKRKVRTPQGAMLRNLCNFKFEISEDTRRRKVGRLFDGKCHRKLNRRRRKLVARVKRCGKSAPREAQATRHGKPHRVQGQIGNRGAARSGWRESATGFGYRPLRQMILSARKGADRIRLTALPKPTQSKGRRLNAE